MSSFNFTTLPEEPTFVQVESNLEPYLSVHKDLVQSEYNEEYYSSEDIDEKEIKFCEPIWKQIEQSIKDIKKSIIDLEKIKRSSLINSVIDSAYEKIDLAERMLIGDITKKENEQYPILDTSYISWKHINAYQEFANDLLEFNNDLTEIIIAFMV